MSNDKLKNKQNVSLQIISENFTKYLITVIKIIFDIKVM
jgi:hypothetical protein